MFIMVEDQSCLELFNNLYYHTPKTLKKLQLSLLKLFCTVTFLKHFNKFNVLSNVINFAIWSQSQHLLKLHMPNHVVEIQKNYDHELLLRKRTNSHIELSNEPRQLPPYDHVDDLLPIIAWNLWISMITPIKPHKFNAIQN
jgi:hypothetical protein